MNFTKSHCIAFIFLILFTQSIFSQNEKEPHWYQGDGVAQGTDLNEMRVRALDAARADALKKAG
ncbi:MAG: hypothetical protein Q8K98_12530 [Bacteroidota bacterium]|nr:hypothetical protein [Bacteroidota bacterium]